ncbi:hypothetical protein HJC23_005069 [Cyclotella cryptica]|uniref:Chitobiosyldiphosphodolichol beta-mannosyltransferase n=1 Tax=Cyclotella cryptica TaxID=29204 RepID=A0ABD3QF62_9STRA|eukprot:CCRYP_006309-RB/>CCRYP_006309-RB protein AED:0.00 eAED:0.00 QI:112/-1/0/1/-1/1/1/78/506
MGKAKPKHAVVMVLGDLGRSPRMQYHALSLLEQGHYVSLVGYAGEGLIPPLENALANSMLTDNGETPCSFRGNLHVLRMEPHQPPRNNMLCRLLYYPLRLASLLYCVIDTLWVKLNHPPHTKLPVDVILVQNPPSVPTLLLAYLFCIWNGVWRSHRPRFVIDWHNLGYTMFDLPDSKTRFLRQALQKSLRAFVKVYEYTMASLADAHLCVTQAMEGWLGENFGVHGGNVRVVYDKPPLLFRPTAVEEQHELFRRLKLEEQEGLSHWRHTMEQKQSQDQNDSTEVTLFTQALTKNGERTSVELRNDRPALLVSSTSWTPDEDFSILLDAMDKLQSLVESNLSEETQQDASSFPRVLVIVTGKGPQKAHYVPLIDDFNRTHPSIKIFTLWLEAVDYPKLLGCATLGISLHTSTSGLDLPMKVLDMFGCHVPVCAIGFDCLAELVKDGVNGRIFQNADELSNQLFGLLKGYPSKEGGGSELETYKLSIHGMKRWKENWEESAQHLIVGE